MFPWLFSVPYRVHVSVLQMERKDSERGVPPITSTKPSTAKLGYHRASVGKEERAPGSLQPAPGTAAASSGRPVKNGDADGGKTCRLSLKISLGISFT